jgi:hypothetical protein
MVAMLVGAKPQLRAKYALVTTLLIGGFVAVFIPIYDQLIATRTNPIGITEYFSDPETLERYLSKGDEVGTTDKKARRMDSLVVSAKFVARDPVSLSFGLGIGNASDSALGEGFEGHYFEVLRPFMLTSFNRILLELGAIGFVLLMLIYWLLFADARMVARRNDGLMGAIAAGWSGIVVVMFVALFYKDIVRHTSLSFLFWYLSGVIAAQRVRLTALTEHTGPVANTLVGRGELSANPRAARGVQ